MDRPIFACPIYHQLKDIGFITFPVIQHENKTPCLQLEWKKEDKWSVFLCPRHMDYTYIAFWFQVLTQTALLPTLHGHSLHQGADLRKPQGTPCPDLQCKWTLYSYHNLSHLSLLLYTLMCPTPGRPTYSAVSPEGPVSLHEQLLLRFEINISLASFLGRRHVSSSYRCPTSY